jgi:hypothetical protein
MFTYSKYTTVKKSRLSALATGLLVSTTCALACGDSTGNETPVTPVKNSPDAGGSQKGTPELPARPDTAPAFLLGTRVWDDSSTTSYFHVVSSLEEGTKVDLSRALEVPGAAKLYAIEGLGWFAIGGGESPTITRYTLTEDGSLLQGNSISLAGFGVQSLWDTIYVVSATKAYYPDRANARLIVWNPSDMTVTGSIDLPETLREGYLALYGYTSIVRGKQLLFSVGWFDWEQNDSILAETGLVAIDTETDSVAAFDTDTRCAGITQTVVTPTGDAYFVSSALAGAANRLGRLPTEPCALRITANSNIFDTNYLQQLGELTGGALAGEPIPSGGDAMFLRVFDESLAKVTDEALTYELTGQAAWRWAQWTPGTDKYSLVNTLQPSTADVAWFQVNGKTFGTETTSDYSETRLFELSAERGPLRALTAPGFLHGVAQIR